MSKTFYTLPDLPYAYDALEPYISKEIMMLHHDKHHAGYVAKLNEVLEKYPELGQQKIEDLIANLNDVPEDIRTAVRNQGGGHVNHSLFWTIMTPNGGGQPQGGLAQAIESAFGSFEKFQETFNDMGGKRFGSGW